MHVKDKIMIKRVIKKIQLLDTEFYLCIDKEYIKVILQ